MRVRWWILLIPPVVISFTLVAASQFVILESSFFRDLGLGRVGKDLVTENYVRFLTDVFYLRTLWAMQSTSHGIPMPE